MIVVRLYTNKIISGSEEISRFLHKESSAVKLTIEVSFNCCEPKVFTLLKADIDDSPYNYYDNNILLTLEDLGVEVIPDGVVYVKATFTDINDDSCSFEEGLKFNEGTLACKIVKAISKDEESQAAVLFYLLNKSELCPCLKDELCELYKKLLKMLEDGC